jgi:hypothetical protein
MAIVDELNVYLRDTHLKKEVVDNVSLQSPIWPRFRSNTIIAAGDNITWNGRFKNSGRVQQGGEGYVIPLKMSNTNDQCSIPIRDIVAPLQLSKTRAKKIKAMSKAALGDYVTAGREAVMAELGDHLGRSIYSDGTLESNAEANPLPNLHGMAAAASRTATYAGISPTDAAGWAAATLNLASATGGSWAGLTFTATAPTLTEIQLSTSVFYLPRLLDAVIDQCTFGTQMPDLITMPPTYYGIMHQIILGKQALDNRDKFGFRGFTYKGCDVVMDKLSPLTVISVWTTPKLAVAGLPGNQDSPEPLVDVPATDFMVAECGFSGNVAFLERRAFGQIQGLNATILT